MSCPSRRSLPESTKNEPATAFSNVDLPDPFVPMTMTNEPSSIRRSTPCRARTSFGVPAWKVFRMLSISSMERSERVPGRGNASERGEPGGDLRLRRSWQQPLFECHQ